MKRSLSTTFVIFALSGSAYAISAIHAGSKCRLVDPSAQPLQVQQQASIDVVFVLDTTGSMGGLIEGAKQKIWSIANAISQAQQTPVIRFGLVGYRDRGDDYVTTITPLTEDLDTVYVDLMNYKAQGGGDTPESVNEALFTAVERFEWTKQEDALKLIYLVGDAPPKMEYQDDVKYQASCKLAKEQGIIINTIQCGNLADTQWFWQEISQLANGAYARIEQSGGVVAITTPYDEQLARLDMEIQRTMIDYGDADTYAYQIAKRARSSGIESKASPEAAADRAVYNISGSGRRNMLGRQELVDDVFNNDFDLDEIEKSELPEELQSLTIEELKAEVAQQKDKRDELSKSIKDLAAKRAAYLREHLPKAGRDGFSQKVLEALIEQGARVGIKFKAGSKPEADKPKELSKN